MSFFKRKHKKYANMNYKDLQELYHHTETGLKNAVASGDEKAMKKAMACHQTVEYSLLYRNSPEFKNKTRRRN